MTGQGVRTSPPLSFLLSQVQTRSFHWFPWWGQSIKGGLQDGGWLAVPPNTSLFPGGAGEGDRPPSSLHALLHPRAAPGRRPRVELTICEIRLAPSTACILSARCLQASEERHRKGRSGRGTVPGSRGYLLVYPPPPPASFKGNLRASRPGRQMGLWEAGHSLPFLLAVENSR